MKLAFFIFWTALTLWGARRLREAKHRDRTVFWCLSLIALAAGVVYAALPDSAGLAEWLTGRNSA
ncbi:MAG: hypothetical protein IKD96_01315 [Oscillospiraceae bacterium]|nr:hypothetical protein [Oscillospiraceae bacterium]